MPVPDVLRGFQALVTGGAGFIGSHLVEALLARGASVRVIDNFSTGRKENLQGMRGSLEVVYGDLRDEKAVLKATAGAEAVFHVGALPAVQRSIEDPATVNAVNVVGTLHVLLSARERGCKKAIFSSSSSVYGSPPAFPETEDMPLAPLTPYGVSKAAGEMYCRIFSSLYGLSTVSLRYFNVFGPRQNPFSEYAAVVPLFVSAILRGQPITIHGDGQQKRDFTPVANVVESNLAACFAENVSGEIINVGEGEMTSVEELARIIEEVVGKRVERRFAPPRPGDPRASWADISKAKRLLHYAPKMGIEEGIRVTVEWMGQAMSSTS